MSETYGILAVLRISFNGFCCQGTAGNATAPLHGLIINCKEEKAFFMGQQTRMFAKKTRVKVEFLGRKQQASDSERFPPLQAGIQGLTLEKTSIFHLFRVYIFFRDFFNFPIDIFIKMEYFNISL
ncbi:MAG: hypothetical protein K6E22_01185 [Treponema sp.]|nr:hypothetical protein [Treponema sp.]